MESCEANAGVFGARPEDVAKFIEERNVSIKTAEWYSQHSCCDEHPIWILRISFSDDYIYDVIPNEDYKDYYYSGRDSRWFCFDTYNLLKNKDLWPVCASVNKE